jgi:hypothetical protein
MDVRALDLAERDAVGIRRQSEEVGETVDCISPSNSQSPSIAKDGHSVSLSANFGNGIQPSKSQNGTSTTSRVRSNVWNHYDIVEENGKRFAVCKTCGKKLKQAKSAGTGTLRNHLLAHEKSAGSGADKNQTTMVMFHGRRGPSSTLYSSLDTPNPEQREKLVLWMVRRNIPFAEVEDSSFREFIFCMNSNLKMMSRSSVRSDIVKLYEKMKPIVTMRIASVPGGICVSVDGWTSECQNRNYIGVVITFIEHWERKSVLLSLVSTDHESQTGEVLANVIYRELKRFNIHSKLFAMASDNGSNMVAAWPLLVDLCAKDGAIIDEDMHARCVCHVINLVVRAFLKEIGANLSLSSAQLADRDSGAWDCLWKPGYSGHARSVNLVRYLTSYVHSSPKRLLKFRQQQGVSQRGAENVMIGPEKILLPVTETATRWNSTFMMLKRALDIRDALSIVLSGEGEECLFPTRETWRHIETVVSFLEPFYKITQELQGNKCLTSAVPSYNELFDHLDDWSSSSNLYEKLEGGEKEGGGNSNLSSEVLNWTDGIEASRKLLSKYYSKTDSRLYSCITFCDPRMRAYYWSDANYGTKWIKKAQSQVEEVYNSRYALHGRTVQLLCGHEDTEQEDSIQRAMRKRARISSDELTIYREGIVAHISADPLMWWKTHATEFPGLSRMSLDMLAIPATTANVERIFSQAKLILTDGRSVLDAELAGKIASLGSWVRELGIEN